MEPKTKSRKHRKKFTMQKFLQDAQQLEVAMWGREFPVHLFGYAYERTEEVTKGIVKDENVW